MEEIAQIGAPLDRAFFLDPPELVAPRLLGKLLITAEGAAGRIVEVEAYLGPHAATPDPAAHSFRGATQRNWVLFGHAGHAYVYAIYGRSYCMNVSCEPKGRAGCVLVRALAPVAGLAQMAHRRGLSADAKPAQLTSGPGRLCQALGITRATHNGLDLLDEASPLQLRRSNDSIDPEKIRVGPRIGIRQAIDWPLRFFLADESCVSGTLQRNLSARPLLGFPLRSLQPD